MDDKLTISTFQLLRAMSTKPQSYAKPDGEAHVSHTVVAERYGLDMRDPFTRVFVAACYWQERAEFWKRKAQEAT